MPIRSLRGGPVADRLDADECWRLLTSHAFGRICFCVKDRVELVPTPYVAHADTLHFRAAAFGPVARHALTHPVTLQVDDLHDGHRTGGSVMVTGASHRVDDAPTLASLWSPVRPPLWESGLAALWITLSPDHVQGRRVRV